MYVCYVILCNSQICTSTVATWVCILIYSNTPPLQLTSSHKFVCYSSYTSFYSNPLFNVNVSSDTHMFVHMLYITIIFVENCSKTVLCCCCSYLSFPQPANCLLHTRDVWKTDKDFLLINIWTQAKFLPRDNINDNDVRIFTVISDERGNINWSCLEMAKMIWD